MKVVRIDETTVVGWRSGPTPVLVDKMVEMTTTGRELPPPLAEEEIGLPLLEGLLDTWVRRVGSALDPTKRAGKKACLGQSCNWKECQNK